jgi:hypothetical protein
MIQRIAQRNWLRAYAMHMHQKQTNPAAGPGLISVSPQNGGAARAYTRSGDADVQQVSNYHYY